MEVHYGQPGMADSLSDDRSRGQIDPPFGAQAEVYGRADRGDVRLVGGT